MKEADINEKVDRYKQYINSLTDSEFTDEWDRVMESMRSKLKQAPREKKVISFRRSRRVTSGAVRF